MEEQSEELPKILFCGAGRCGKTSILKVVFSMMSSHECWFLEPTQKTEQTTIDLNSVVSFEVVEFPGNTTFDDPSVNRVHYERAGAVVIVIDHMEEPFTKALVTARKVMEQVHAVNKRVSFDILIHKSEGERSATPDSKAEIQRTIHSQLTEGFDGAFEGQMQFHCTSIQDHTIFEAMSKVVQRLIPMKGPVLQQALTHLAQQSNFEKAYLFDMVSKVYIASDAQPADLESYEFCADMIDVVIDISCIYSNTEETWKNTWGNAHDPKCYTIIQLLNGRLLYLREVDRCLALVCIIKDEHFDRPFLIDYNIGIFKEALVDILKVTPGG